MGLKERRAIKAFEEGDYKKLVSQIQEVAAKQLDVEVDWEDLAVEDMDHLYETALPKVYFQPVIMALEKICFDEMGKEALAGGLDKIVIQNKKDSHLVEGWAELENKVLTLDIKPFTNIDYISERAEALQATLEKNL